MNALSTDRVALVLRLWAQGRGVREVSLAAHVAKETAGRHGLCEAPIRASADRRYRGVVV
jgi:hypothetical protein